MLTNIAADGSIAAPTDKQVLSNRANQIWHTDSSFKPMPARASLLSAREIPSQGGDTQYASMRAAYAALSDEDKRLVEGLVAVHDFGWSRSRVDPALVTDAERADNPPVRQAVVMDSPNGKALYLGAHARFIEGMDEAESRALIDRLIAFGTQERFVYSHRWARMTSFFGTTGRCCTARRPSTAPTNAATWCALRWPAPSPVCWMCRRNRRR